MDRNPGLRTSDRRTSRPQYPPCQHSRDERLQLSSGPKPRPKGWLKPVQNRRARRRPPLGLRPPGCLMRAPQVAWFCSALWPEFTPALTALRYVREKISEYGMFAELDLLADPAEPRDLYGMLLRSEKKLAIA